MQVESPHLKPSFQEVQGYESIAAIMENRANEVGIAVFTPDLNLISVT